MDGKCSGGCGGGSEEEEGYILHSPLNTSGISSRKRIKLQGKVPEVRDPVDPALVPRRLRSAMNKRTSQSASPPLSDSVRRKQHASHGAPFFDNSSVERFKQNMLNEEVTKDEEEVAEALTSMASLFTVSNPAKTKEDGRSLGDGPESMASREAPKEEGKFVPCKSGSAAEASVCVEDTSDRGKTGPCKLEQATAAYVCQTVGAAASSPLQPDFVRKHPSSMEPVEKVTSLRDSMNTSNPLKSSLQSFPRNGLLLPKQLDNLPVQGHESGSWPLGSSSMKNDLKSFKRKPEDLIHEIGKKATDVQPGSHNRGCEQYNRSCEQLAMPSSSKFALCPSSITVLGRPSSTNGFPMEKVPLTSTDKKQPWKKCTTHVRISHLIWNYQKAVKKQPYIPYGTQSKAKERRSCTTPMSGESSGSMNGVIPPSSASFIERGMPEARKRMLQDGRIPQARQAAVLPGAYVPKKQTGDHFSLSVAGDTRSSANGLKSSGQLHVPCPPNHAVLPFTFPQGCFTSQYQEQLTSGPAQQVQLQLPHYIASSSLYGPQMGQAAGGVSAKQQQEQQQHLQQQQQLMWQAHLAHYRPPVSFPAKWQQNGRQHSSSSSPLVSQPLSMFSLPADYKLHNLHQPFILPMPLSSSSLPSMSKKQPQNDGGLNPQSSSHLQMICSTETFR